MMETRRASLKEKNTLGPLACESEHESWYFWSFNLFEPRDSFLVSVNLSLSRH